MFSQDISQHGFCAKNNTEEMVCHKKKSVTAHWVRKGREMVEVDVSKDGVFVKTIQCTTLHTI